MQRFNKKKNHNQISCGMFDDNQASNWLVLKKKFYVIVFGLGTTKGYKCTDRTFMTVYSE